MATLLDADWATGATCSGTNLNDGVWSSATNDDCLLNFDIGTGGPGGRNYMVMNIPGSDSTSVIGSNTSLGNPATMFIRFWFKKYFNGGEGAHFVWVNDEVGNYGSCLMRSYNASTFSIWPHYDYTQVYYYTGTFSFGTWYRIEFKIVNAGSGSANASMFVRMDGVDVTSSFTATTGGTLADHNGSLQFGALNQFYFSSYQQATSGHYLDLAGLKITDGPDWIGGDNMKFIGTQSENLSKIDGVSVSSINKILGYDF